MVPYSVSHWRAKLLTVHLILVKMLFDDCRARILPHSSSVCTLNSSQLQGVDRTPRGSRIDSLRLMALMHGGAISGALAADLWQWDGVDWSEGLFPLAANGTALSTRPRLIRRMTSLSVPAGDPGGYQAPIGDTWELTSGTWAQNLSVPSPSPRRYAAMVFDAVRREFVRSVAKTWVWGPMATPQAAGFSDG